jgi:predicted phosphodiesterase
MPTLRCPGFVCFIVLAAISAALHAQQPTLPLQPDSVRFAAIGDMGNGGKEQYAVAGQMATYRGKFPFDFVLMLGDNLIGGKDPVDYQNKFELPYKPLLDAGVKFYAVFGNHDISNERFYKLFNMNGQQYYTYKKGNVRFFALDSNYMDPQQLTWLEKQLQNSDSDWKICYFHHPLYSSGAFHGSSVELRLLLEPLFVKYGVNVVFSGHEHIYERVKPQNGITYFTEGASGELRKGNLTKTDMTAAGYDQDRTFMLVEIAGNELHFQTISQAGLTVDSGMIERVAKAAGVASWPTVGHERGVLPRRKLARAMDAALGQSPTATE